MDRAQQSKDSATSASRSEANSGLEATGQEVIPKPEVTSEENDRGHGFAQATSSSRNATRQAAEHDIQHEDHLHGSGRFHRPPNNGHSFKIEAAALNDLQEIRQGAGENDKHGVPPEPKEPKPETRSRMTACWVKDAVLACKKYNKKVLITKSGIKE